jgi:hypothetical protein
LTTVAHDRENRARIQTDLEFWAQFWRSWPNRLIRSANPSKPRLDHATSVTVVDVPLTGRTTMARNAHAYVAAGLASLLAAVLIGPNATGPAATAAYEAAAVHATAGVRLIGGDISWPNCPTGMGIPSRRTEGQPLPTADATDAIIGLTYGRGFHPNPCLADQVAWAKGRGLWTGAYAVATFPTTRQRAKYGGTGPWSADHKTGRLRNTGYQQAAFNVASMHSADFDVPMIWVDVEPYAVRPWSASIVNNRDVLRGVVRGYEDSGYRVGFYSYERGWRAIVGAWHKTAYPAWVPVGQARYGRALAAQRCGLASFSRGDVWIGQWVKGHRDKDITCRALTGRAAGLHELTRYVDTRLRRGAYGAAVVALQRALGMSPGRVDGYFGARTLRALRSFQSAHGLTPSGVSRPGSWRALGAGSSVPKRPSRLAEAFTAY